MSLTINEIAQKAGVSIGTVDRVIHNRGRVSKESIEKIQAIINEYGYQPNPIARQLKTKKDFVIGVLLPDLGTEQSYWKSVFEGMKKAAEEFKLFSIKLKLTEYKRHSSKAFVEKAKELSKEKINALITAPIVAPEIFEILPLFSNVPYVFVDSPLDHDKQLTTVAQDPYQGGYCAGRIMDLLVPNAKKIITVQMYDKAPNLHERSRGFAEYFNNPKVVKNITYTAKEYGTQKKFIEAILKAKPDGIFVTNEGSSEIADYCKAKKITKSFALIGYDLMEKNVKSLKEGNIDCLISQSPQDQGYLAVKKLYQHCLINEKIEREIFIPINIFFKENI